MDSQFILNVKLKGFIKEFDEEYEKKREGRIKTFIRSIQDRTAINRDGKGFKKSIFGGKQEIIFMQV